MSWVEMKGEGHADALGLHTGEREWPPAVRGWSNRGQA
jgi:hypothetical protein